MRRFSYVVGVLALALVASSCASSKATGLPAGPTEEATTEACDGTIDMTAGLKFEPEECTITAGTEVTWTIVGSLPHTVTSEPDAPVTFDSGNLTVGDFSFTFEEAGTVPYYCKLHASPGTRSGMVGTIIVEAA